MSEQKLTTAEALNHLLAYSSPSDPCGCSYCKRSRACFAVAADALERVDELEAENARLNKVWLEAQQRATKAGKERTELFEREQAALAELGERQRECAELREALEQYADEHSWDYLNGELLQWVGVVEGRPTTGPELARRALAENKEVTNERL